MVQEHVEENRKGNVTFKMTSKQSLYKLHEISSSMCPVPSSIEIVVVDNNPGLMIIHLEARHGWTTPQIPEV